MSAPILKLHVDERDNISVRVSQDVQVLTCEEANRIEDEYKRMQAENAKLREYVTKLEAANLDVTARLTDYIGQYDPTDAFVAEVKAENVKLREQMERLVTLLRVDCDIDASWDGLRRFWSVELTEGGCLMRDRACKAEADNAKLRELVRWMYDRMDESCAVQHPYAPAPISYDHLMQALARARELGVEVNDG